MQILGVERLELFGGVHGEAGRSLKAWRRVISETDFEHFPALKRTLGSASYIKPYTVFNICGTKYRLITIISYAQSLVLIKEVFTHQEYDEWSDRLRRK